MMSVIATIIALKLTECIMLTALWVQCDKVTRRVGR